MTDLEIGLECRDCGWTFKRKLWEMEHGRALTCPFCRSMMIDLKGDAVIEEHEMNEVFDKYFEDRFMKKETKV